MTFKLSNCKKGQDVEFGDGLRYHGRFNSVKDGKARFGGIWVCEYAGDDLVSVQLGPGVFDANAISNLREADKTELKNKALEQITNFEYFGNWVTSSPNRVGKISYISNDTLVFRPFVREETYVTEDGKPSAKYLVLEPKLMIEAPNKKRLKIDKITKSKITKLVKDSEMKAIKKLKKKGIKISPRQLRAKRSAPKKKPSIPSAVKDPERSEPIVVTERKPYKGEDQPDTQENPNNIGGDNKMPYTYENKARDVMVIVDHVSQGNGVHAVGTYLLAELKASKNDDGYAPQPGEDIRQRDRNDQIEAHCKNLEKTARRVGTDVHAQVSFEESVRPRLIATLIDRLL